MRSPPPLCASRFHAVRTDSVPTVPTSPTAREFYSDGLRNQDGWLRIAVSHPFRSPRVSEATARSVFGPDHLERRTLFLTVDRELRLVGAGERQTEADGGIRQASGRMGAPVAN